MAAPDLHATVLFAHGSRDPAWRAPIEAVAARMAALQPGALVRCAYLELDTPDLPTAIAELLHAGATHITVWPMFLGSGRHAREDLPRLLATLRSQHPQVPIALAQSIGVHPEVLDVMARVALGPGDFLDE